MTREETIELVTIIVSETLGVPIEEVSLSSHLKDDLEAEHADIEGILSKLSKAIGLPIPLNSMERRARASMPRDAFEESGFITQTGLARLRELMPGTKLQQLAEPLRPENIPDLYTVETLVDIVLYHTSEGDQTH